MREMQTEKECWICGKPASRTFIDQTDWSVVPESGIEFSQEEKDWLEKHPPRTVTPRMYCKECFEKESARIEDERKRYGRLKKSLMFERAVRILERQDVNIYEYKDIIEQMRDFVAEHPEKFDSADEIIAAIILVDNEIEAKMQYKVGKYRVDFLIPQYKIALEIDGGLHALKLYKDNERDIAIRAELGRDWEVVRIGAKYLEQNAEMLVEAMKAVKKEKQKIRRANYGVLPDWYSARDKAIKKREIKVGDENLFDI